MLLKVLKWIGFLALGLILLAAGFYAKVYFSTESRFAQKYKYQLPDFSVEADSAMLAEGERLMTVKGCNDCHGTDLGGRVFIDDPALGRVAAPNLTRGKGGLPADFTANDWLRALKHGVNRDSTTLRIMPSYEYAQLTERDLKAIIAFGMSLPAVDRTLPPIAFKPVGRILIDLDKLPVMVAEKIDHNAELVKEIVPAVNAEFGRYIAVSCSGCHKENLKGGEAVLPGSPPVADITSTGNVGKWTQEQFLTTMRTGKTPEGKELQAQFMPWPLAKSLTDTELQALYVYLRSI
ncbi:MAG: c-type cytochrome [Bacteroidota bacterium]